ncbi:MULTISPECIES: HypC/HybG/HupF family hydrogenase formation chaperone [Sphingomonadales]|jgi:hydrogenase expression/formation protein HypC|uniref:Hydrogenase maturation factor HypC n=3 Tax=Sphingomonadales TaxID=204457 RepID=Q1J412_SPHAL|nr:MULTISPECIES: HypC/HybG/HupF family hydrogenase formation chaperone [Sphingomonadales]KTE12856.1 hydrogenase formation protein HypC [Sphingopyxis sp. H115]KTE18095.1 hydrogenase formation protein HypC [Sphingopyxis sp. H050]MAF59859.1 HypC/HybG/HupF family hydrogenase formation chaperone [Blastomonas sp.]MAK99024.1 HypC/HybG/HupF family hydrogenase formation chaperone [Citromicrobium sp.]MCI5063831.1 HypC/HybG/HupF family hydrogenase formation chaperone [Algiphilus sp.]MEA3264975.1 HypC/Hy|tara:strand:- start:944 stop:1240 length:297 start_codon:yes stop_codon:yes gene_type:complete
MCLGIPGQIVEITDAGRKLGVANVSGVRRPVNLACVIGEGSVEDLIGTWVLIHVGFAMSKIDEDQAAETLRILTELGEAQQELAAMRDGDRALGDAQW